MQRKLHPILVRLLAMFIFISVASIAYLLIPDKPAAIPEQNTTNTHTLVTETLPTANLESAPTISTTEQLRPQETQVSIPENLTATLKVQNRTYTLHFQPTDTLLVAMQKLTARSEQPFMFSGKEYPTLGYFVEEINDQKNNPETGKYWIYYSNGQPAKEGISTHLLTEGETIEWKYANDTF